MKKINYFVMTLLVIPLLFGCAANQDNEATDKRDNNDVEIQNVRNEDNDFDLNNNNGEQMDVADEAADHISKLEEVQTANVIVTNRNAYVAVTLRNGAKGEVTDRLENRIADQVRKTDSDIQNVFVSSNPDFVQRMNDYGDKINNGDPIEGFFEEFNEMVRRVFPNAR